MTPTTPTPKWFEPMSHCDYGEKATDWRACEATRHYRAVFLDGPHLPNSTEHQETVGFYCKDHAPIVESGFNVTVTPLPQEAGHPAPSEREDPDARAHE